MTLLSEDVKNRWIYGSSTPFAEPPWANGCPSPYYGDSHRRLRQAMRTWVEKNIVANASQWEADASLPDWIYTQAAVDGILMPMASGASIKEEWREKYPIIGDVRPEEWDGFHDYIIHDEFGRVGGIG